MNLHLQLLVWSLFLTIGASLARCQDNVPSFSSDSAYRRFSNNSLDTARIHRSSETVPAQDNLLKLDLVQLSVPDGNSIQKPSKLWIFNRKTLALGGTLAFSIPIVMLEYQWWWRSDFKSHKHSFVVNNEGWFEDYSLGVDKCGHFYTSYLYFRTFYDLMKWADYSETTSLITAFTVPAAHAISIELCDGFSKYGFSFYDLTANFVGMGYAFAQIEVPYLQNFNFKWSYYKTPVGIIGDDRGVAADYTGHTYWLSIDMKNVLPEAAAQYWPKYLNLAVGYGASNVTIGEDLRQAKHKFAFALDYNLSAIPIAEDTWAMLVRFADKFHYPAPGIKTYDGEKVQAKPLLLY
jgi:hypothetical protein